jgi:hypothetical protein
MSLIVKDSGGADFELLEAGLHPAVCSHVVDIGLHHNPISDKDNLQVVLCFELAEKMADGRPFMQSKIYTASLHKKANLRKDLESWRGKIFTDEELKGFDLEKLKGAQVYLNIAHKQREDKTYANITGLVKLPAGFDKIIPTGQPIPEWILKLQQEGMAKARDKQDAPSAQEKPNPNISKEDLPF